MSDETQTGDFAGVNGTRLRYEMRGSGEPLVLIHGFSLDLRVWDPQIDAFERHCTTVRYDLRGFGASAVPDGTDYRHADDLAALLDHLGIEAAHVLGLSLGGGVALDFVLEYPERANSLILVDAIVPGLTPDDLAAVNRPVWRAGRTSGADAARALWLASPLFAHALQQPDTARQLRAMIQDYSGWGWTNSDPGRWADLPAYTRLHDVAVPTLVVVGEHDIPGFHEIAKASRSNIPDARHAVIVGAGHLPNLEQPEAFNRVVLTFLHSVR